MRLPTSSRWLLVACSIVAIGTGCAADEPEPEADTEAVPDASSDDEADESDAEPADEGEDAPEEDPQSVDATTPAEAIDLEFQLNWTWFTADHTYLQVADTLGYFEEEGLNVSFQEGTGSGTTLTLVASGSGPSMGLSDAGTVVAGIAEELPVKVVGVMNQISPLAVLFKAEKGYEEIADLEGETIALTFGDAMSRLFPAVLSANGMSDADVEQVGTPNPPAKEVAVLNDDADAFLGFYTEQGIRLNNTPEIEDEIDWIRYTDAGINTLSIALVANTDWLSEDPQNEEAVRRFIRAFQRGIEYTLENPEEAAQIFTDAHPDWTMEVNVPTIEETTKLLQTENSEGQPYLWSAEEDWDQTRQLLEEYLEVAVEDDLSVYYTNEYIE